MRERQVLVAMKWALLGITPAYAGKTLKDPNKIAISITEIVKYHSLFKSNLPQKVAQRYCILMK